MISVARELPEEEARSCEWHVADVTALPFADGSFSVAICQQGIQFFPDERAALQEMRRVLRPGGRVALSVWAGASALFIALAEAIGRHVSPEVARQSLAPFAFDGLDRLQQALADLGFGDLSLTEISVDRVIARAEAALPKEIMANPIGPAVAVKGAEVMDLIVAETLAALSGFRQGAGLVVPQRSHLLQDRVLWRQAWHHPRQARRPNPRAGRLRRPWLHCRRPGL